MRLLTSLLLMLSLANISYALTINEIMANTVTDEALNEWIELYNNESSSINISGWIIGDDSGNDTIEGGLYDKEGTIIEPFGFAIITDDATRVYNNFNVSSNAVRLYTNDSSIGNGLGNDGETIYLFNHNKKLVDKKTYNKTAKGLSWAFVNNTLYSSNPSPGYPNSGDIIFDHGCDIAVEFILSKTLFDNSSDFNFKVRASKISGSTTNFTARAKIEDLNGRLIREYKPFTNNSITRQRTSTEYTPNLEEGKSYIMETNITLQCNDTNPKNNFDNRIITVKGKPLQEESVIDIERIYDLGKDKKAEFGQTIRLKLNAYKGNTNKKSVAVWIEDDDGERLSKQSRASLDFKYTNYSLTLPVQIDPNCDSHFKDDDYLLIAKGLDSQDEEDIEIEDVTGSLCETIYTASAKASAGNFEYDLTDFSSIVEVGKEYSVKVILNNNNNQDIGIKVWSYIYRGPKSYSGNRQKNMKELVLKANSLQVVELTNMVEEGAEDGNYRFKVLVNKNNQKTNNEIIKDIKIKNNINKNNNIESTNSNEINFNDENNKITNNLINYGPVYEASTEKAKHLVPVFLLILSVLLSVVLIWRR